MKVYPITSALSAYVPERAILMSERVRANNIEPYINTVQIQRMTHHINKSRVHVGKIERLFYKNANGEKFTPLETAMKSPFRRFE